MQITFDCIEAGSARGILKRFTLTRGPERHVLSHKLGFASASCFCELLYAASVRW